MSLTTILGVFGELYRRFSRCRRSEQLSHGIHHAGVSNSASTASPSFPSCSITPPPSCKARAGAATAATTAWPLSSWGCFSYSNGALLHLSPALAVPGAVPSLVDGAAHLSPEAGGASKGRAGSPPGRSPDVGAREAESQRPQLRRNAGLPLRPRR